jgi:hypothetical protein
MLTRKLFAYAAGGVLLSLAAAAPALATGTPASAHNTSATVPCVTSLGVCDARFAVAPMTSFATGNWYFESLGGKDDTSYWHAYYYSPDGNQHDYGVVSPN